MSNSTVLKRIRIAAFGALGILLALSAPVQAAGNHGGGFGGGHDGGHGAVEGGHGGGGMEHHGFEGHHFEGHHFEGHDFDRHDFDGRFGFRFGLGVPYYQPYYAAPSYWYYCPSYGAYYPSVTSCPEAWVTVPGE
jgi:hypothetical protein